MSDDRRLQLGEVINRAVEGGLRDLYTLIPAKVVKWDASKQRADCQPLVKNVTQAEDESREVTSWPVVTGVPVQFVGAGNFRITCPISDGTLVGDDGNTVDATTGCLVFSHRSVDKWLSGDGSEVDPEFDHDHALTDAVFMPGLRPFGNPWGVFPTDHMTIGHDGGVQAHFHKQTIALGDESGNDWVALAMKVNDGLTTFFTLIDGLFGNSSAPIATVFPGTDAVYTAFKAAIAAYKIANPTKWPPADVSASQVKAK